MDTQAISQPTDAGNVVPITILPKAKKEPSVYRERFRILPYVNPATGTQSWRVTGSKRDGVRIRENYANPEAAKCRQMELTAQYMARQTDEIAQVTKLTPDQLRLAELAFARLDADAELMPACDFWITHGRQLGVLESPRLDEAVSQFNAWLETADMRPLSKADFRCRIGIFANSVGNVHVSAISADLIEGYLDKRKVGAKTKSNDLKTISRFCSWCIDRPRRWLLANPCAAVSVPQGEKPPPAILTVEDCETLLQAAQAHEDGILAPYVAVCLFAGLRPAEASRLTWDMVNLVDSEISLPGSITKTGVPRVIAIGPTLKQWLAHYKGMPFCPPNLAGHFKAVREALKGKWVPDVLRHTSISHFFRKTGSYGLTAEFFGNSEAVIKAHYQARVSSEDTAKFYALLPIKKG